MGVTSLLTAVGSLLAGYLTDQSVGTYDKYAVATDTPLCSKIGTVTLKANGSAVDAAIAAMFCLGVVSMHSSGIGGGGVMLVYYLSIEERHCLRLQRNCPSHSLQGHV